MTKCENCGSKSFVTKQDANGKFKVCSDCGLRQDGLGQLQKRFMV
jgi:transcription initiation factor TFIIIB Brf1 subunit/transcription initiation factor TFIIB